MSTSDHIPSAKAELSPERRALLERWKRGARAKPDTATTITRRATAEPAPLSFAQQRLWFLDQFEQDSALYNLPEIYRVSGALNLQALRHGLDAVVARHETLRTSFANVGGAPTLTINEPRPVFLKIIDVRDNDPAEREAVALQQAIEESQRPFDLTLGPTVRAMLVQLDEQEYILLLNMHHIASDGWSHNIFVRELAAFYTAHVSGQSAQLPELEIQYTDFAAWQRQYLQGEVLTKMLAYWKQQLSDVPALELPTDRPRPAMQTHNGAIEWVKLPKDLTEGLKLLAQQEGATLFMVLLAGWQTLLARYTGQRDVTVGTLIANRNQAAIEGLIGFFVNTLALRTRLHGNPTFREVVQQVRSMALEGYAHQDLPFEQLLDELNVTRDTSRSPLFQTMLVLQTATTNFLELPGVSLQLMEVDSGMARFDLTLVLRETEAGLTGAAEFNIDLFDPATIARLIGHYQILLTACVNNPDQPIADLPLLTARERYQLCEVWNATASEYPHATLHQLVAEQAARTPDAVAVVFEDQQATYRELDSRANRLANTLRSLGVGKHAQAETLVALCVDRSVDLLVGLLGILKAGGAYMPLDADYPLARLHFMLEDSQAPLLVTQSHLESRLHLDQLQHPLQVLRLDTDAAMIAAAGDEPPSSAVTADSLAYMIYTSGSTGKPKGVQIEHRAVVNFLNSMRREPGLTGDDTLLAITSLSFDIAELELLLPLLVGGRVAIVSRAVAADGEQLRDAIVSTGATAMQATPSTWRLLLGAGAPAGPPLKALCGGEALPQDLAEALLARSTTLWNMYGPTETTIWSAVQQIHYGMPVVIGHPIANTQIYILDANLQPLPIGVPGELHIGGAGLSRGYRNRPELTAERFVPHPWSERPGERLYKTGDLARFLMDGTIEFLGRIDYQVKVRGFRIELGEIETALLQHSRIREAVAVAREDGGHTRLIAYIVENKEQRTTEQGSDGSADGASSALGAAELRVFLKDKMPEYMIPSTFMVLDKLPLTPNGKIDRKALPTPDGHRPDLKATYVAPRTPEEATLAAIWSELLSVAQVGINDNFFELGGDSLQVIRVVAKASQAGLKITSKQLFQHQTVAELAAQIGMIRIVAEQGLVAGVVPFTPAERDFLERNHPNPHYYSIAFLLEAEETLNPAFVEQALNELVLHHDSLRVRFVQGESGPQIVNDGPFESLPFTQIDLSGLSEARQGAAIKARITEIQTTFDLAHGPLLKGVLFDLGPEQPNKLLLVCHYFTADLLSWQILLADLDVAYRQLRRGEAINLPSKTTSRQQWGRRLNEHAHSPAIRQELGYWLSEPRRSVPSIPLDFPDGVHTIDSYRPVSVFLSVQETQTLMREIKLAQGTSIDDVLLTALLLTIAEWSGNRRLLVDLLAHGRVAMFEDMDVSRTMGWLNITYPVLLDLETSAEIDAALKAVRKQMRQIPNHGMGYSLLRYLNTDPAIQEQMRSLPPTQVNFNYMGTLTPGLSLFRLSSVFGGHRHDLKAIRPHPLAVTGTLVGDRLRMDWLYSDNVHRRATIERLAASYTTTLKALTAYFQDHKSR
jgi:amino acid adenylation domain-containing protein/non-ribosomal peptide synthase protein (TIGR01720 family)